MSSPVRYKMLSDTDYKTVLPASKKPVIIIFSASWSGNAVMVDTVMKKVIAQYNDVIEFYKIDIDENPEVSQFFNVSIVPTLAFFNRGEILEIVKGFMSKKKLISRIENVFDIP